MKTLALFDLDNTLIAGDSDEAWQRFLCDAGVLDARLVLTANRRFYSDYQRGRLNMNDYIAFVAELMNQVPADDLADLQHQYIQRIIKPMILPEAQRLVREHSDQGHYCIIISATNHLTVGRVASLFAIDLWMATELEYTDGRYTGRIIGHPCYQEGKVRKIHDWLAQHQHYSLERACFYSDSINDKPLLEQVARAVAVNPDADLRQHAQSQGWEIISLQN